MIKTVSVTFGVIFILSVISIIGSLKYIQFINSQLPSPDNPFKGRDQTTIIYASNFADNSDEYEELYTIFDEENRISLKINEVPEHVKWAILAAEDIDFYEHKGFDLAGITKAVLHHIFNIGEQRGGSTITQQLIKQTTLGNEVSFDRKLREILMAIQVERKYTKDEILEMYLNVNNFGSNVYGLKTAAKFYFDKDLNELTIAEAALLARIPQNPVFNSPTLSPYPEDGKKRAISGMNYVLDQMKLNLEKINDHIEDDEKIILAEEINSAAEQKMAFQNPLINIQAPHFVFYVEKLLTTENYNNGKPFELNELQKGGYRIYTTLDMNIQKIAEEEVMSGVNNYSMSRNGHNGAAIITNPKNGDIIAMVGSKSYDAQDEGKYFNGQVNVVDSLQSMGSSMKPAAYYKAFEMGISSPGSYLPDIPISIGNYSPRNWDGRFKGSKVDAVARSQLSQSRNLPAVILVDLMGKNNYINTLIDFGYKTIASDPNNYGPSLVLGGGDVTMIEHAQAYGIFANNGNLTYLDPIQQITKYDSESGEEKIVYERSIISEQKADPKAVYLVNHVLNYKNGGPGDYIDGRDYAGKTGTTELHKDTIYVGYTPDFVVVGWNGNNDNTPMYYGSWGENVTKPWVISLSKRIASHFPEKLAFSRPGGIISYGHDLAIDGRIPDRSIFNKYSTTTAVNNSLNLR